jgi:anti-sigma factor RsiW
MACEVWTEKIEAYVDGELAAEAARSFDQHLKECAGCAAATLSKMQLKQAVHIAGRSFAPDPAFRARIQQQIAPPRATRAWRLWVPAMAMAIVLIAVAVFLPGIRDRGREQQLISELTDLHVATLASANPVDVVSTDRHTVKPWFAGRIPFTFNLPDLQGSPFSLAGGKIVYLEQSPGAELIFHVRKHQISLFIFQEQALGKLRSSNGELNRSSFNVRSWSDNGLHYFLIGDVNGEDLNALKVLLKAAAG